MRRANSDGLLTLLKDSIYWNFYEWQSGLEGAIGYETPDGDISYDLPLCGFVSMAYQSVSKIYDVLGDKAKSEEFAAAADKLNRAAHELFYSAEDGFYYSKAIINSDGVRRFHLAQLSNSLAVYSGICPESELDSVLENLAYSSMLLPVTLSHSIFRYDALMKRPEKYSRYVFSDAAKYYGNMLFHEATTFWETAEGGKSFGYAGSLCHGWSAVPIYLYFRYAAGIVPEAPGVMGKPEPLPEKLTGIYEISIK